MNLSAAPVSPETGSAALVGVLVPSGTGPLPPAVARLDALTGGVLSRSRDAGDFRGRDDDALIAWPLTDADGAPASGPSRVVFIGLGSEDDVGMETLRKAAGRVVRTAESLRVDEVDLLVPDLTEGSSKLKAADVAQACAEGLSMAAFDFRELRSEVGEGERDEPRPPLVRQGRVWVEGAPDGETEAGVRVGAALAAGANLARTLQFRPGNVATPTHLAEVAAELAKRHGFGTRTMGPAEIEAERMGALLSVARGSDEEPRFIVLEHMGGADGEAPLALVGKGLTFDAGGISLKPAKGMESMKFDMSGGAAVLGAMESIGRLGLPVNVVGVVPSSENLLNGRANKPGDVVTARSGKTIEIINTDAEGRLILADALDWTVETYRPAAMVDCATLTGACVVALGHQAAALMSTDDDLAGEIEAAGEQAGELCWRLPLWSRYRSQLDSPVADLRNVGGRPAGSITAGLFLKEFAGGDTPWAHLDIAGTAYGEPRAPYQRTGGFGFPARLLVEWVRSRGG